MLKGKVAIVTGGSRGIGFATVKKFLDNGAKVALCGSKAATVDKALELIKADYPNGDVLGFYPNLNNKDEIKTMVDGVMAKWGRVDILVNNAGISSDKSIADYSEEDFAKIMDINVQSIFNCSKAVAPTMKAQKSGVILNTSSVVSLYAGPNQSGYATSKFAVNGLTKSLARELGQDGIRVNAVAPGIIATDMVADCDENTIAYLAKTIPLGRMGQAEDIANAFLFLASDQASYISGTVLSVDGALVL